MAKQTDFIQIEGRNMVHDALYSKNTNVAEVLISLNAQSDPKISEILKLAQKNKVQVRKVDSREIEKLAGSSNAQGVIAYLRVKEPPSLEEILKNKRDVFLLMLNHIDYEQNLGAILRTAWAAGVDAVIASPNGVHKLTSVVAKISMGGAANVPLIGMSLFQAIDILHRYAVPVIGVEVNMGKVYSEEKLSGPVAFLMGGEEVGLTEPLIKTCDSLINIPMTSGIASLNVSVATGLVLFEKVRQEREMLR